MQIIKSLNCINPTVYSVSLFDYKNTSNVYSKIGNKKSQYCYRFIFVNNGAVDFEIDGNLYHCKKGSIIFLVPNSVYRIIPCGEDFSFIHVFFDFIDQNISSKNKMACVFVDNFNPFVPSCKVEFANAPCFNQSGVFNYESLQDAFSKMLVSTGVGEFNGLRLKELLIKVILSLVNNHSQEKTNIVAKEIVNYIKLNAKTVCAELLQQHFGYHKNYINRLIKDFTGSALTDVIRRIKIERAKEMILELDMQPSAVAIELGYYDYSHFYKAFKQETGVSPTDFKYN